MGLFSKKQKTEPSCCGGNVDELIIKDTQGAGQESDCGCDCSEKKDTDDKVIIKVLGSGCKNCITLADNVKEALKELKLEAEIVKVTDFGEITSYGVMSTPALVVNEKVVSYGKVLKAQEIIKLLNK